jgi:hypothetical protein
MFATASLFLTTALAAGQADAPLAWKLKEGDTFYVKTVSASKTTVEVQGMTNERDQDQTTCHRYTVLSADAGGFVVEQTVQQADFKDMLPGLTDVARKLQGRKLIYTLNAKSEVTKVEGYDKVIDAIAGDDDALKKPLPGDPERGDDEGGVTDLFGFLPGKVAKVGDAWKRTHKFGLGPLGAFQLTTDLKLAATDPMAGDRITWTAKAAYTAPDGGDDAGLPFTVSKADLTAEKFAGEYLFDATAGRLKSSTSGGKMSGKMTIAVMGQEVEMDLKQNVTITTTVSGTSVVDD